LEGRSFVTYIVRRALCKGFLIRTHVRATGARSPAIRAMDADESLPDSESEALASRVTVCRRTRGASRRCGRRAERSPGHPRLAGLAAGRRGTAGHLARSRWVVPGLIPRRRRAARGTALDDAMPRSASLLLPGRITSAWHPRHDHAARSPRVPLLAFIRVGPPVWSPHVHRLIRTRERLSATGAGPQRCWSNSWTGAWAVSMSRRSGTDLGRWRLVLKMAESASRAVGTRA
jgi:hypothetical protein